MKKSEPLEIGCLCKVCGWRYLGECTSWYCRGNVARFEKWKIALGTRIMYLNAAPSIEHHSNALWIRFMMDAHRRGTYDKRAGWRQYSIDAGYCIDAPNEMPAGGCYGMTFEDIGESGSIPGQLTVAREPQPHAEEKP